MDKFSKELWKLGEDSPELQQMIANMLSNTSGGYSIPTGDYLTRYINMDDKTAERFTKITGRLADITLRDLYKMQAELSTYYTLEEVQGRELEPYEKTLRDIDLVTLALVLFVKWKKNITHEEGSI